MLIFIWPKIINLMKKGRNEEALKILLQLQKKYPYDQEIIINIARLYFKMDNLQLCKSFLNKLLQLELLPSTISSVLEITNWYMLVSNEYFNNWPSFSLDGDKIIFTSARRDTNEDGKLNIFDKSGIYIIDRRNLTEQYIISDEYYNISPSFSPDGEKIIYLSVRNDTNNDGNIDYRDNAGLYLADLKKGVEIELISDTNKPKNPSFAPDGKHVLFSCWMSGKRFSGIYTINIETREIKTLVDETYENTSPSFSSDGSKILFTSWREDTNGDGEITIRDNTSIFVKDLRNNTIIPLVSPVYNNSFPTFSKDGKKILYLSTRRDTNLDGKIDNLDNSAIVLYDMEKKKEEIIQPDVYYNKFPSFTFDNKKVVFLGSWRGKEFPKGEDFFQNKGVYCIDLKTKRIQQIVCEKYYGSRSPVPSPTRNEIVYLSWRKNKNRGLYLAFIDTLPTKEELKKNVENNL